MDLRETSAEPGIAREPSWGRLMHDLRGPVSSIERFVAELELVEVELEAQVAGAQADGADAATIARHLARIIEEDLRPCLECLAISAGALTSLADEHEARGTGE